jgi:hypothetical protein
MLQEMSNALNGQIEVGYQVFVKDGGDEVGAVRDLCGHRPEIAIYVENAVEFTVPITAIRAVHFQKVIVDQTRLPDDMRAALRRAQDAETD